MRHSLHLFLNWLILSFLCIIFPFLLTLPYTKNNEGLLINSVLFYFVLQTIGKVAPDTSLNILKNINLLHLMNMTQDKQRVRMLYLISHAFYQSYTVLMM